MLSTKLSVKVVMASRVRFLSAVFVTRLLQKVWGLGFVASASLGRTPYPREGARPLLQHALNTQLAGCGAAGCSVMGPHDLSSFGANALRRLQSV